MAKLRYCLKPVPCHLLYYGCSVVLAGPCCLSASGRQLCVVVQMTCFEVAGSAPPSCWSWGLLLWSGAGWSWALLTLKSFAVGAWLCWEICPWICWSQAQGLFFPRWGRTLSFLEDDLGWPRAVSEWELGPKSELRAIWRKKMGSPAVWNQSSCLRWFWEHLQAQARQGCQCLAEGNEPVAICCS